MYQRIIVHGSDAHADDFLSACVARVHSPNAVVLRKTPSREDMCDMLTLVLDVGMVNDGDNHLDHHVSRDLPCSFHLYMQKMGLHTLAQDILPGYEFVNTIDTRGPLEACNSVGMTMEAFGKTASPIQNAMLGIFEGQEIILPESPLGKVMHAIGHEIINGMAGTIKAYERLMREARIVYVNGYAFLDTKGNMDGVGYYMKRQGLETIHGFITSDQRGEGYAVMRDKRLTNAEMDFTVLKGDSRVDFVHANGFFFTTKHKMPMDSMYGMKDLIGKGTKPKP